MSSKEKWQEFEYNERLSSLELADHLIALADGLRKGSVYLSTNGSNISLTPTTNLRFNLKAEQNEAKGSGILQLELSWKKDNNNSVTPLEITASVPELQPAVAAPSNELILPVTTLATGGTEQPKPAKSSKTKEKNGKTTLLTDNTTTLVLNSDEATNK